MFGKRVFGKKKKSTPADDIVSDQGEQHLSSHTNVAAASSPVSAEAGKPKKRMRWMKRFFGQRKEGQEMKEIDQEEDIGRKTCSLDPTSPDKSAEPNQTVKRTRWWKRLFKRGKKKKKKGHRATPDSQRDDVVPSDLQLEESIATLDGQLDTSQDSSLLPEMLNDCDSVMEELGESSSPITVLEESNTPLDGQQDTSQDSSLLPEMPNDCDSVIEELEESSSPITVLEESNTPLDGQQDTSQDSSLLPEMPNDCDSVMEELEESGSSITMLEESDALLHVPTSEEIYSLPELPENGCDTIMERIDLQQEDTLTLLGGQLIKSEDFSLSSMLLDYNTTVEEQHMIEEQIKAQKRRIRRNDFGFPNIGQSCYMNSSLQSLLTLEDFTRDISCLEHVGRSVPKAQLIKRFTAIRGVRTSTDSRRKSRLLHLFKRAVSVQAPTFSDQGQKDAHEFLTTLLDQMRSPSPLLQDITASRRYTCPVEDHLVFKMENTTTCKRCGAQSKRQEEFINLSLDLVPGGNVEQMLEEYMKETELDYKCDCGGKKSGMMSTFATLPKVLILHMKRFRFTSTFGLVKVHDRIKLPRDLLVSSKQGGSCYSLVSIISHFGYTAEEGHYISDGVHPDNRPDEPTDRWLTFNDGTVTETSGASVCGQRQDSAYILFYKRHV